MSEAQSSLPNDGQSSEPQNFGHNPRRIVRWRPALLAALLVLALTAWLISRSSGTAALKVTGRHGFRSGSVSISVDGKTAYSEQVSGSARKRYGLFEKVAGTFAKTLVISQGEHVVEVRFTTPDGYEQIKRCGVKLLSGSDASLQITAQRSGLSLSYQGPPVAPSRESDANYFIYVRSFLVTIGGSALSAAIGFIVQDFLKSKRAAQPATVAEPTRSDALPT